MTAKEPVLHGISICSCCGHSVNPGASFTGIQIGGEIADTFLRNVTEEASSERAPRELDEAEPACRTREWRPHDTLHRILGKYLANSERTHLEETRFRACVRSRVFINPKPLDPVLIPTHLIYHLMYAYTRDVSAHMASIDILQTCGMRVELDNYPWDQSICSNFVRKARLFLAWRDRPPGLLVGHPRPL